MSDPDSRPDLLPGNGSRVPNEAQAMALRSQVMAVLRVLYAARDDAASHPFRARARVLEKYGPAVDAAMLALGETLADFVYDSDQPVDLDALRANFLEPILALSRSLPIYQRAEEWQRNKDKPGELHELVLEGRLVGFDPESLLLDYFYENTVFARSLRTRAAALARLFYDEVRSRHRAGVTDFRALVLGANSVLNLVAPVENHTSENPFYVLIVDSDTQALRLARQRVLSNLGFEPSVLRLAPESLGKNRVRIGQAFDVIYSLLQYDMHSPQSAFEFTRGLCQMLKPGGALLTGSYLPDVPQSYRALAVALGDLEWGYWDESTWREMLAQLPFDLSACGFEMLAPATLTVLARRSTGEKLA